MFESSLLALDSKKQRSKRWLSVPTAIGLHFVVFASVGFAQYWSVDSLAAPQELEAFQTVSLPAPPVARGEREGHTAIREVKKPATQSTAASAQPPSTVPDTPVPAADPQPSHEVTDLTATGNTPGDGPAKGDPNGVEHGDPFGIKDGKGTKGIQGIGMGENIDDAPIAVNGAVTRPVIVRRVEPKYTELARRARLQGTVIVEAVIDEQGNVVNVKLLRGLPMGLDTSAVDAVSRWHFQPATLHGRPVKVFFSLSVIFTVAS